MSTRFLSCGSSAESFTNDSLLRCCLVNYVQHQFSSSTRIENVSATTLLRFTPQRRRRGRRPAVVGGLFEGVAEPD